MAHGLPDLPYLGNDERENLIAEQIGKASVFQRRLCVFQEVGSLEAVTDACHQAIREFVFGIAFA